MWFLDANCNTVRVYDPATGVVTTLAGDGAAASTDGVGLAASLNSPRYMTHDNSGLLYIAETQGRRIRVFNTHTNEVTTFAGDGTMAVLDGVGTAAQVSRPRGMTSDGTSLYFVEFNHNVIRQGVLATRSVTTMLGTASTTGSYAEGQGSAVGMSNPFAMAYHWPSGRMFFLDGGNAVIRTIR